MAVPKLAATVPLVTTDDLVLELGVPKATLYNWRTTGKGPRGIRVGKHLRYRRADVDAWLEQQADPMRVVMGSDAA